MDKRFMSLRLRQVDALVQPWKAISNRRPPPGGWLRAFRQALGMSAAQLGGRIGVTRQAVADLELREVRGAVTLAALQAAAEAMSADLVYAIVPRRSLLETRRLQARAKAEWQTKRVAHSMRLEAQDVSADEYESQVAETEERLLRDWSRSIWDEES